MEAAHRALTSQMGPTFKRGFANTALKASHPSFIKFSGGRSSVSGMTVAVFGAGGFLGRYVVNQLGPIGSRIILPYRGEDYDIKHLKVMGDLGQIYPFPMSLRNLAEIETAVADCNVVINMLGKNFDTMAFSMHDVHVKASRVIAQIAAAHGVQKFIQFSALGASLDSPSEYLRTKALGEHAVKDVLPDATLLRIGTLIGHEDKVLNAVAYQAGTRPYFPVFNKGLTKLQPVYVNDVAECVLSVLKNPATAGQTYELAGEKVYTKKELMDHVYTATLQKNNALNLPYPIARVLGMAVEKLPKPEFTQDMVAKSFCDQIKSPESLGMQDLGVAPTCILKASMNYLKMYRPESGVGYSEEMEPVKMPGA